MHGRIHKDKGLAVDMPIGASLGLAGADGAASVRVIGKDGGAVRLCIEVDLPIGASFSIAEAGPRVDSGDFRAVITPERKSGSVARLRIAAPRNVSIRRDTEPAV